MMMRAFSTILIVILLWNVLEAQHNVDTEEPIVIRSPAEADPDDGFGWAAIFHQIEPVLETDSINEVLRKTRVIISAPRGTYPGGLNLSDPLLPAVNKTGLVYSCPIGPGDCEGIRGDTSRYFGNSNFTNSIQYTSSRGRDIFIQAISEGRLFDQSPDAKITNEFRQFGRYEVKEGQHMGAFLYSNGDHIVACAPRWVTTVGSTIEAQPRGICFIGDRNLTNFKTLFPCNGGGSSDSARIEGYCSTGYGVTIVGDQIHIGTPKYQYSGGAVFSRSLLAMLPDTYTVTINPTNIQFLRDSRQNHGVNHGYQVVSGYIQTNDRTQGPPDIIVSAPRDSQEDYLGRIYSYTVSDLGSGHNNTLAKGTQMGEYFGYSVAVSDLTGDGYDELLVGAPFHSSLQHDLIVEHGRLYVFFNNQGVIDPSPVPLDGFMARSRFGFTVANAGDLDADGHEDFAVSAPYEMGSDTENSGAVYIYYGRNTKEAFMEQTPQKIHADDIVASVSTLSILRTFGFSLSGNMDIDKNGHNDLVVGGYMDQAVVVLRTLPVVNITFSIDEVLPVQLKNNGNFNVTVRATYASASITGPLNVSVTLVESVINGRERRLYFSRNDRGDDVGEQLLEFSEEIETAIIIFQVYTIRNSDMLDPYQLMLNFNDTRNRNPVTGHQNISNLSLFPRFRLLGNATFIVPVIDPCGTDGCASDVVLTSINPRSILLVSGRDATIQFNLTYSNEGPEDARGLTLQFSGLSSVVFRTFTLISFESNTAFNCSSIQSENFLCVLQQSLRVNENRMAIFTLFVDTSSLKGNENNLTVTIEMAVDMDGNNTDVNLSNNHQAISFFVSSESNINVNIGFSRTRLTYTGMVPTTVRTSEDLGRSASLTIRIGNDGPSTILNARVLIQFPDRLVNITGSRFFLYPQQISIENGRGNCSRVGLDPEKFGPSRMSGRQKRSRMLQLPHYHTSLYSQLLRIKRQTSSAPPPADIMLDCAQQPCTNFTCDIQNLTTEGARIIIDAHIDERFFGELGNSMTFSLTATTTVFVIDEFQRINDDESDNFDMVSVLLVPSGVGVVEDPVLIHTIIWPAIGGALILVILVIFLYSVGFFRRKKHNRGEETEGDAINIEVKENMNKDEITSM